MPYKDKEQAKACWRRRNATPKRKAYMRKFNQDRMKDPEKRKRANAAIDRWRAMPTVMKEGAERQHQRRMSGQVKAQDLRSKEEIAGRPKPERCEVCGRLPTSKGLHFDHCHKKGHFRGWLCNGCNCALGFVNDDPQILLKLAAYLQRTTESASPQLALIGI